MDRTAAAVLVTLVACTAPEATVTVRDAGPGDEAHDAGARDAGFADAGFSDAGSRDGGLRDGGAAPGRAEAYAALESARRDLTPAWWFRLDPDRRGDGEGWFREDTDFSSWSTIDAGATWESQGHAGYDGVAWYARRVRIPSEWAGSAVRLAAAGIDDEYDVYVNGTHLAHRGQRPDRSVFGWRTFTRLDGALRFGEENLLVIRVEDWGGDGGIWRDIELRRAVPMAPWRHLLPEPVLPAAPDHVALYWEAWRMAWEKIAFGTARNGLAEAYMDEGFNEQIYQWDSSFIVLFGRYGHRLFPVMPTIDNFYAKQRPDGYIQRVYSETTGGTLGEPTPDEPMVNPPLFAWVEWAYYRFTGDASRFVRVLDVLERYDAWLEANVRSPEGRGLYYQTDLGSGMDNLPRRDVHRMAWIDMSAQQAHAARLMGEMATVLGEPARASRHRAAFEARRDLIDRELWNEAEGTYYDLTRAGLHAGVRHLGAYWTLLAEVADDTQARRMVVFLEDPAHFARPHPFPVLSAADPDYEADGHYWRGGVWAPTNYMVVRGLYERGFVELARRAARDHLDNMVAVHAAPIDEARIAPEERDGEYRTIWECYAPESAAPATRWDDTYYSRQDFVGWSGLGPIALLIEQIIGLEVAAADGEVVWNLHRTDEHGVRRVPFGDGGTISLVAAARADAAAPVAIEIETDRAFTLEVRRPGRPAAVEQIEPGVRALRIE